MYPYNPHLPLHYLNHAMHPSEFLNSTSENLEEARQNSFLTNRFEDELAEMIWDNGQISTQELSKFPDSHTSITPNSHNICDYSRVGNITIDPPADLGDSVTVEAVLNEYVSSAMISSGLMDSSSAHRSLNHPTYIGFPHEDVCSEPLLLPGSSSFSCHISDYPSDVINHAMPLARDTDFVGNNDFAREVTEKVNLYSAPLVPHSLSNFSHFERPLTQSKADNKSSDHHEQVMGFESLRYVSEKSDLHGEIEKSKKRAEISSSVGDVNEEITCKQRLYVEKESNVRRKKGTFQAKGITGSKRRRATEASEVRNLSEKRRRALINEKIRALQQLVPNSRKADKASMLDEAIKYIQALQFQIQIMPRIQLFMQSAAASQLCQYFPSSQVPCRDFFYGHEPHHRLHNVSSSFPRTVQTINNNIPPHVTNCAVSSNASTSGRIKPIKALVTLPHGEGSSSCSVTCKNSNKVRDSDDNDNNSNRGTDARKL